MLMNILIERLIPAFLDNPLDNSDTEKKKERYERYERRVKFSLN